MPDGEKSYVDYPGSQAPLPTPEDLRRAMELPLVQIFVAGRSGSMLVHSYLDGHPEILHVPHMFKFFDSLTRHAGLTRLAPREIASRLAQDHLHFFDSASSVHVGGRLGADMRTYVRVDIRQFERLFEAVLTKSHVDERAVFSAFVLVYASMIGQDVRRAKVIVQHLHHGDWLWPELLQQTYNCYPFPDRSLRDVLRPAKFLVTCRHPASAYRSACALATKMVRDPAESRQLAEVYLMLLIQDWHRMNHAQESGFDVRVLRLEDLRRDPSACMRDCAAWLGIDPEERCLGAATFFGLTWHGDIYSAASAVPRPEAYDPVLSWQDRWFLYSMIGRWMERLGYRCPAIYQRFPLSLAVLLGAVLSPPKEQPSGGDEGWARRHGQAVKRSSRRLGFAARHWLCRWSNRTCP